MSPPVLKGRDREHGQIVVLDVVGVLHRRIGQWPEKSKKIDAQGRRTECIGHCAGIAGEDVFLSVEASNAKQSASDLDVLVADCQK